MKKILLILATSLFTSVVNAGALNNAEIKNIYAGGLTDPAGGDVTHIRLLLDKVNAEGCSQSPHSAKFVVLNTEDDFFDQMFVIASIAATSDRKVSMWLSGCSKPYNGAETYPVITRLSFQ